MMPETFVFISIIIILIILSAFFTHETLSQLFLKLEFMNLLFKEIKEQSLLKKY